MREVDTLSLWKDETGAQQAVPDKAVAVASTTTAPVKNAPYRKLRGYAFDPSLSLQLDTVDINIITYKIPWENLDINPATDGGFVPTGEYVEIIDIDPATGVFYLPVNLGDPNLLAQDGLDPSVSSPQFHQQMVYAVVMTTITNFEKALGRKVQWAEHIFYKTDVNGQHILINGKKVLDSTYVRRLRIYPHALRQANAYYNPQKKALLFGYFPATPASSQLHLPGGTVFTCLSHDIIAHETTHAILDGLHRRYTEPTHPDTRAFHEAFADIVALFQHFTFPAVLKEQICRTRGDLGQQNLLGQLAEQFGKAMGHYGGLRDAIGRTDKDGNWIPHVPDPRDYQTKLKFHDRGAILVAAIFDVFINLYKRHASPIIRIASGGSGQLAEGELHPDLANQLAILAAETATRILHICVRALDYCPPNDITFGDYLRAIITSDRDMVEEDRHSYRIAFIEAFQKRGIYPKGIKSMSVESLCYQEDCINTIPPKVIDYLSEFLREFKEKIGYESNRSIIYEITKTYIGGESADKQGRTITNHLHGKFSSKLLEDRDSRKRFGALTGLFFPDDQASCEEQGFVFSSESQNAKYEIGNLWLSNRVTPEGKIVNNVIVTLLQRRGVEASVTDGVFAVKRYFPPGSEPLTPGKFIFRGGATLIFDLDSRTLKYAVKKDIADIDRMEQQFRFTNNLMEGAEAMTYFNSSSVEALSGPFAFMHGYNHHH
jgi:hypothetical protein